MSSMIPSRTWCLVPYALVLVACGGEADPAEGEAPGAGTALADKQQQDGGEAVVDSGTAPKDGAAANVGDAAQSQSWCDVQAVLDAHCTSCHRAGGVGPMALTSYDDLVKTSTVDASKKVYQRLGVRTHDAKSPMPPTGMLDAADLRVLDAFVAAGAPAPATTSCADAGTSTAAPVPSWPSHCDATYRFVAHAAGQANAPYVVPAGKEIHPQITFDAPWGDQEVQAIAFRPITDNAKVLHHWILNATEGTTFLSGWAPGGQGGSELPEDVGMYMPSGAGSMFLDIHYFNVGSTDVALDQSGVEVCVLYKAHFRPKTASVFRGFGSVGGSDLVLAPAGASNHVETGVCKVSTTQPVTLLTSSAHAHRYAVHMKFTVKKADGREIVMHDKPFSFDAQLSDALPETVTLSTGDQVITTCTYTNDTTKSIRFGESTSDEMCFNFAVYYPKDALSCAGLTLPR
jgi:hypothetical protein